MTTLSLIPQSPQRACLQILLCALLFRARPDLLPRWPHVALTMLVVAVVATIRSATPIIIRTSHNLRVKLWHCTQHTAKALRRATDGLLLCLAAMVLRLRRVPALARRWVTLAGWAGRAAAGVGRRWGADLRAACAWLWPRAWRAAKVSWTCIISCIRLLAAEAPHACHALCTDWPRRRVVNLRGELARGMAMGAAVVRSSARQLIWVCLFTLHFLSFTLGLTVMLPLLCAYGLVVSFLHLLLSQGTTTLASDVVSLLGL
ncbi:hypothetical protein A9K55_002879 [Cordyceps militaris]|uniref:Uncharacterized protein n=1 Tax=Cordyceps militaris TaxID=73501 RepID=A0A2H4S943_CORMI|nr:hypothetical protein A9K55_002879 [Cordyceps militaris]